jgi:hypothetical protein
MPRRGDSVDHRHSDPRTEPEVDALFDQLTARIDVDADPGVRCS